MKKETKSRRYTFTIFDYKENLERFLELAKSLDKHRYIVFGIEKATDTGNEHIQGYVELNEAQRFTFLHKYFGFKKNGKINKFHIEIANGNANDNKKYTSKDGNWYEFGTPLTQGSRSDMLQIKNALLADPKSLPTVIKEQCNNHQQLRYAETFVTHCFNGRNREVSPRVYWIFGRSGVGKTKLVYDTFGSDICTVSNYSWIGTGYQQQECLLFDDFRIGDMRFEEILKVTDRYPHMLYFKGGQIPLNSPFIIFTSPRSIDETFNSNGEDLQQLKRRIVQIHLDFPDKAREIDLRNLDQKHHYDHETGCYPAW